MRLLNIKMTYSTNFLLKDKKKISTFLPQYFGTILTDHLVDSSGYDWVSWLAEK